MPDQSSVKLLPCLGARACTEREVTLTLFSGVLGSCLTFSHLRLVQVRSGMNAYHDPSPSVRYSKTAPSWSMAFWIQRAVAGGPTHRVKVRPAAAMDGLRTCFCISS
ncbi:hypothetical protein RRG08_044590 [Elysia crispata]|uniref:Uncharacterized protein n=1 Tax=Elysia crispata TaxID=231223 RepID=A0AAE0ZTA4_9GAST|nr:hypothetical protein RRG08_044590 [Elysia crispata]